MKTMAHKFELTPKDLTNEIKERLDITENGAIFGECTKLLFTNNGLFCNTGYPEACSFNYFLNGRDQSTITSTLEDIFAVFGLQHYYRYNKKIFDDLEQEHKNLSAYGNILMLSLLDEDIKKSAYISYGRGTKKGVYIQNPTTDEFEYTENIITILDALKNTPEQVFPVNELEFCFALTHDLILRAYPKKNFIIR
jgi:hypothetical protein